MAFDVESKYLYNGFSYLGKDWTRSGDASLPTDSAEVLTSRVTITLLPWTFIETHKTAVQFGGDNSRKPKENSRFVKKEAYVA